jgi:hypothetical protein
MMTNNTNEPLRKLLVTFLTQNLEMVQHDFTRLRPKERVKVYRDLLKFGLPVLRAIHAGIDFSQLTEVQLDTIIEELRKTIIHESGTEAEN